MFAYSIKIEFSLCFSFELARHKKTALQYIFRCINTIFVQTSVINAGDLGSIPGWESSPEEGIGYPLQYSWALLVVQLVKNLPVMRETWIWSLHWEDPLEKGKATHSSILSGLEKSMAYKVHGVTKSQTWLRYLPFLPFPSEVEEASLNDEPGVLMRSPGR